VTALLGVLAFVGPDDGGFSDNPVGPEIFETGCLIGSGDNCFNRTSALMIVAALIVAALFLIAFRKPQLGPRGLQNVMESLVEFIRNSIIMEVMGPAGLPWLPFLTAMFGYILVANLFGIIPFVNFPVTSRMAIPAFLAVLVWLCFVIVGFKEQGLGYLKNTMFPPGVPWPIYILMAPIEFISVFLVRPFSLAVRLLGNTFAGHLILTIFALGTVYLLLSSMPGPVFAPFAFALDVALTGFEMLVAVLQAYIFTILTAVYIGSSMHPEH
jgi:F-type H+-transporting ATPase subunit a